MSDNKRNTITGLSVIALIWILIAVIIGFRGDFPICDDYDHAFPVKSFIDFGKLSFVDYPSKTMIAQTFWGIAFSYPYGFSFDALRLSSLVLGLFGVFGTYILLKRLLLNHRIALTGAILLIANPFYLQMAYTFHTDIPFFTFFIWAILFLTGYLQNDSLLNLISGIFFSLISVLIREIGLILPIAFIFILLFKNGFFSKKLLISLFFIALSFGIYFAYRYIFLPSLGYYYKENVVQEKILGNIDLTSPRFYSYIISNSIKLILFFSLYFIPVLIPACIDFTTKNLKKIQIIAGYLIFILGSFLLMFKFPVIRHNISDFLLAPVYGEISYNSIVNMSSLTILFQNTALDNIFIFLCLTSAYFSGIFIVFRIKLSSLKSFISNDNRLFLVFIFILYLILAFLTTIYGRYLLPLIPPALIFIFASSSLKNSFEKYFFRITLPAIVLFLYISVASTYDMMNMMRIRNDGIQYLINEKNAIPGEIDGGYEYNTWIYYNYKIFYGIKLGYPVRYYNYRITFGRDTNFRLLKTYNYTRLFPPFSKGTYFVQGK